jgi:hypothetical protein
MLPHQLDEHDNIARVSQKEKYDGNISLGNANLLAGQTFGFQMDDP